MGIIIVVGVLFAIIVLRAYFVSREYNSYKEAQRTTEYSKSEILVEKIEEKDGMFWVKFTYKIAGRKFPIEKLDVAKSREEAEKMLLKYKMEFNSAPKEMKIENNVEPNKALSKTFIWGIILIVIQIVYNAMLLCQLGESIGYSIGYSMGSHILTIIAIILFYKAYKNK